jgi:hypothetical protein
MKLVIIITFLAPVVALMVGYDTQSEVQAVQSVKPVEVIPTPAFLVTEYKFPKSDIVVTVNQFPFDVGGSMPYQISAHGKKYKFDPADVEEFLKKGKEIDIDTEPLPVGMWVEDSPFPVTGPVN